MATDFALIKKLVSLFQESNLNEMEVEDGTSNLKIKMTKGTTPAQVVYSGPGLHIPAHAEPVVVPAPVAAPVSVAAAPQPAEAPAPAASANLHEIKSPIVGTFYRSPGPDAEAFVKVGDTVTAGKVLCIVEAMKLMNEIEADVSGKIVKILVENGKPVEYNQPLFLIEKA